MSAPPAPPALPPAGLKPGERGAEKLTAPAKGTPRGGSRAGAKITGGRGRYTGSTRGPEGRGLALDAMMRAAALRLSAGGRRGKVGLSFGADDVRYKRLSAKAGTLYIFAVDTSGSMALNRIGQAKGAVASLLRRSYVNRDRVALVSFRERGACVLLSPCAAPARAKRILDALPVGGPTPLGAGLLSSLEVARKAKSEGAGRVVLLLFTDGRANVPLSAPAGGGRVALRAQVLAEVRRLGAALAREGVTSFVVDTGNRFTSGGEGAELASSLGGTHVRLPEGVGTARVVM